MTAHDRDELAAKLFRAARAEHPSRSVRDRTLRAMRTAEREPRQTARAVGWRGALAIGIAVAAAAALALIVSRRDDSSAGLTPLAEPVPSVPPSERAAFPSPPVATVSIAPKPPIAPAPSARPRPSLADETAALDRIRRELEGGNDARALELLDRYERGGAGNRMSAEATLLRIEALARAGRASEAKALARTFISRNPGNPLIDRARAVVSRLDHPTDAGGKP